MSKEKVKRCIKEGRLLKLQYYIDTGFVDVNTLYYHRKQNLLHLSAKYLQKNIVEWLIQYYPEINLPDSAGNLPITIAIKEAMKKLYSPGKMKGFLFSRSAVNSKFFS